MGTKPFKTLEEQIAILKDRNLIFENEDIDIKTLSKINYYNVVNGYKKPFLKKDLNGNTIHPEEFIDNCHFKELVALYELDRDLKGKIFEYILIFERTLKSYISYYFSEEYAESFPYLNIQNFSKDPKDTSAVLSILTTLSKKINEHRKPNSVAHYIKNHDSLPLWVLINELTLGNASYMFRALDITLREKISKQFSLDYKKSYSSKNSITSMTLVEIIKISIFFRNICAHDNVMLLFKMDSKIKMSEIQKLLSREDLDGNKLNITFQGENLYDLICSLKLVLSNRDFENLISGIDEIFKNYTPMFKVVSIFDILLLAGFQSDKSLDELLK